jgi:hypothetical protein
MKISLPVSLSVLLMAAMSSDKAANAAGHDGSDGAHDPECTHGKLYIMDDSTSNVYVVDVHDGLSDNMIIGTALTLPSEGSGGLTVYGPPADPLLVQYRGVEPDFDGFVRVIDTGFSFDDHGDHGHIEYTDASVYSNAIIEDCPRPIHEVRNGGRIAIFCDGAFDAAPEQKNTTIFIVDESKLGTDASSTTSAIVHTTTLEVCRPYFCGTLLCAVLCNDGLIFYSLRLCLLLFVLFYRSHSLSPCLMYSRTLSVDWLCR